MLTDLNNKRQCIVAAVKPSSALKPAVVDLKDRSAYIRQIDLEAASENVLLELFKDIDIVLIAIHWTQIQLQYPMIDAAKKTGVKRFIPCDWAPACVRGVRKLHDEV